MVTQLGEDGLGVFKLSVTSRLLENFISNANIQHITDLMSIFRTDWTFMITDRFASHILQSTLNQVPKCLNEDQNTSETADKTGDKTGKNTDVLMNNFVELCDKLQEDFDSLWTDMYGSHIIRVVLQVLGGTAVDNDVIRSRVSRDQARG